MTKIYIIDSNGKIDTFEGNIIKRVILVLDNGLDVYFCENVDEIRCENRNEEDKQDQGETASTDSFICRLAIPSKGWSS